MLIDTDTLKLLSDCLRSESNEVFDGALQQCLVNLADRLDAAIEEALDLEIAAEDTTQPPTN